MVTFQKNKSLAIISFHQGDSKNNINLQTVEEIKEIQQQISIDHNIRVIVITGSEIFSIGTGKDDGELSDNRVALIQCLSMASVIDQFDQPTIAAITGEALGQGLELVLACDFRLCTETAHFAMNHLTYGDIPCDGGTQRLSRIVGKTKAMEMILTGETIDAQEAHQIGLIHQVLSEADLFQAALDSAQAMASKGPIALRYAKEAVHKGMDLSLDQGLRLEADLYFLLHTTKDRTEGIRAFQEKRAPSFEGR